MKSLTEKFKDIINGWANYLIFNTPEIQKVALKRLEKCLDCDANTTPKQIGLASRCKDCGCVLEAKVRNETSECPRNKW